MNWQSGYERIPADRYETPEWVTEALLPYIGHIVRIWEPAAASGKMADVLKRGGRKLITSDIETGIDFLKLSGPPPVQFQPQAIITNPPYSLSQQFIEHALELTDQYRGLVAMLLPADYDHAITRRHLFDGHPAFATKVALRKRIRWIEGTTGHPRAFHAWFIWDWRHKGHPTIRYEPQPLKPGKGRLVASHAA